jgi:thiol-disulfide isomerase/thioredoxin
MIYAIWLSRLLVAAVFAVAAWGKLSDRAAARHALRDFGVPDRFVVAAGWALPAVELVIAAAVLPSATAVPACGAALVLLTIFTGAIAEQLRLGRRPSCSCFGAVSSAPIGPWTLVRNAAVAGLIVAALWGSWLHGDVLESLPVERAVGLAAIVVLAAVQVWQAVTVQALRRDVEDLRNPRAKPEGLPIGTLAPDFELPGIDGRRGSLRALLAAGRPVALLFVHPGCGPCQSLIGELGQWRDRWHESLVVMPIGSGDLDANTAWAREHGVGEMLVQDGSEVAARYRLRGVPMAVLLDARGRVAAPPARGPAEVREFFDHPTRVPVRT